MRYGLVISVEHFTHPHLRPLPGAAADGDRIAQYLRDPERGACDDVWLLRDPSRAALELALSKTLEAACRSDGMAIVYIASHGVTRDRNGLWLCPSDTDPERLAATALSIQHIAAHVAEQTPRASIFIFDVCNAGGLASGAAALALDQLWAESVDTSVSMPDGHFLLGACSTTEYASEDNTGGVFTSLLLAHLETLAHENPHLDVLLVETVAGRVVAAARDTFNDQRPTWSGVAISGQVVLSRNPYFVPNAQGPEPRVDLRELTRGERVELAEALRQHASAVALIGGEHQWSVLALDAVDTARALPLEDDAKTTFIIRAAEGLCRRLGEAPGESDVLEACTYLQDCIVNVGAILDPNSCAPLLSLLRDLSPPLLQQTRAWASNNGWLGPYGPADAVLAPVMFWQRMAICAIASLACRTAGSADLAQALDELILATLRSNPRLHRLVWAAQYPDVSVTMGIVLAHDVPLARSCTLRLLDRLVLDARDGFRPMQTDIEPFALGRAWAQQIFLNKTPENPMSEEAPPFLLMLLLVSGASDFELNQYAARLIEAPGLGEWCLYQADSVSAQFVEQMSSATAVSWAMRESMIAVVRMFEYLKANTTSPYDRTSPCLLAEVIAGACAGCNFRNRAGFGLPAAILHALKDISVGSSRVSESRNPRNYLDLHLERPKRPRGQPINRGTAKAATSPLHLERPKRPRGHPIASGIAKAADSPTIHLNVWFPDRQGAEVTLTVGVATRIRVNLAHRSRAGSLASERVSDDAAQRFYEVDHVDVFAICPGADVWPLRARLPLPPEANAVASFEITPRRAGQLELAVILLIEGESIHQTKASILASAPTGATTEAPR